MAKMMMLQQSQPSFSLLTSSLSDFNGAKLHLQVQYKRKVHQPKGALYVSASSEKKILIMGGTRFIGVFLSRLLVKEGHQVTLFTRGKSPIAKQLPGESDQDFADFSSKILHLKGDRKDYDFVKSSLSAEGYDVVYDINGRESEEVEPIIDALPKLEQYIYCSSAGVYLKSDTLPHCELTRRAGTREAGDRELTANKGVNWTSIRPVYIYGPLNYNPVEEWFFHRLKAGRPIPVPNSGIQISQLGHVKDLATAFLAVLGNEKASREIFNISGEKYVTFDGLARACAKVHSCWWVSEPEIVHYNPKEFDFGKKKAFPFRDQYDLCSISLHLEKAKHVLGWKPEFDLVEGLTDSYNLDFGRGTFRKEADFTTDDMILSK
ncbi:hypothetical protein Bca52824_079356 [Brassica carinata]|uniref:NAD-dependent epimerase/dehydratase domain-containing protein n=1 Tax=Brassica carinata TaxID=52824 RepID=A0A8X7PZ53_BRACI|nr:hypothetical protein Bca52824_079356 [Brassica carinata]